MFHTGKTKIMLVVKVHDHLLIAPSTMQCQLYVCGDTSWWRGQALKLGHSYSNLPCTNMDGAQQFSTVSGDEGVRQLEPVPSSVEVNCCLLDIR